MRKAFRPFHFHTLLLPVIAIITNSPASLYLSLMETPISSSTTGSPTVPAATATNISISTTATSPTTFVQADPRSFKELVQKLTGVADDSPEKMPITMPARFAGRPGMAGGNDAVAPRRSAFKLHERRQSMRKLEIKLGLTSLRPPLHSPRSHILLASPTSGTIPEIPMPSPVTPLDPFENGLYSPNSCCFRRLASPNSCVESPSPAASISEEERAIAEKGFYLHPSPLNTPGGAEPELLTLFPLQSPKHCSPN